jgi:hypothetical protein
VTIMKATGSETNPEPPIFVVDEKNYGKSYKKHMLEQYKLCVEMADRISSRRGTTNNFFLSLNSLLVTAIGILSRLGSVFAAFNFWWVIVASFAGLLFCWCWSTNIRCYRELNAAKFKVINAMENKLPVAAFEAEWKWLNPKSKTIKYPQLTRVEHWVPVIFAVLYIVLIGIAIILANEAFLIRLYGS